MLINLYNSSESKDVARFESEHFDFSFGSGMPLEYRDKIPTVTYAYFHSLFTSPVFGELREFVEEIKGWDWEEMFLHFKEDTYMDAKEITTNETIWVGNPTIKLYQVNSSSWMYPW